MLLLALSLVVAPVVPAATTAVAVAQSAHRPPSVAEVERYTRPLVRARLRLPESLQGFVVTAVTPMVGDVSRFEVEVRFRARTPFGAITQHSARFRMKQAARQGEWLVTAE